jgi:hypothetical protein
MRLNKLLFTGLSLPFLGLFSCSAPTPVQPAREQMYFNVPGFIEQQAEVLTRQQAALQKTVFFRAGKPEVKTLSPVNWKDALQNFRETDLNKKALGEAYAVSSNSTSEGQRTLYTRKPKINTPVKSLEVLTDARNQVKMLRAVYEEDNALFYNREIRELYTGADNLLNHFTISGVQKVILFDSIPYQVKAEIKLQK